jgi:RND family efflux transporter MFP subunit
MRTRSARDGTLPAPPNAALPAEVHAPEPAVAAGRRPGDPVRGVLAGGPRPPAARAVLALAAAAVAALGCLACGGSDAAAPAAGRADAAAAAAAAGSVGAGAPAGSAGEGAPEQPGGAAAPRNVEVAAAAAARLPRTVQVAGTLAADEQVALAVKVAGRIDQMPVDLGSRVRQGDLIARLAQPDFTLRVEQAGYALDQARARLGLTAGQPDAGVLPEATAGVHEADAQLRQASVTYQRQQSLFRQQLISQQDLDAAQANFQVAEARREDAVEEARNRIATLAQRRSELAIARQALLDSTLTAPFDGAIRERRAAAGDYLAVGQPVVVLVRTHPLRLRLAVPERDSGAVRVGQAVQLTVEGDARTWEGRVARISPAISEDNRTLMVEAEVPNQGGELRPGAFARAAIVVEEARTARPTVLVPASAIVSFAGIDKVLGVEGGRAKEREVRTGRRAGALVEVLAGVAAGEPVVVNPGNLVGGQPVRVVRTGTVR